MPQIHDTTNDTCTCTDCGMTYSNKALNGREIVTCPRACFKRGIVCLRCHSMYAAIESELCIKCNKLAKEIEKKMKDFSK